MVFGRESNGPASPVGKNSNWRWLFNLRILMNPNRRRVWGGGDKDNKDS
jgi:hypothetical protein